MKGITRELSPRGANILVAAVAVVCFINVLPNDFCFDDIPVVRDSPKIQGDNQWAAIWTTDYWSQTQSESPHRDLLYRPVALSVIRLTRVIAGQGPLPFHLLSIALHALCAVLVAQLIRELGSSNLAGMVSGLVFAVLPIHSEVVASVVGQTDLLAAAGTVCAILCHFRFAQSGPPIRRVVWMMGSTACAFVAMGAKESGICVVPLVVLAAMLGVTARRASTLTPSVLPEEERGFRPVALLWIRLAQTAYVLVPLAAYLSLRYHALGGALHQAPAPTKTVNVLVDAPAWQHALGVLQAWGMYWAKTFYPRELCIEYAINSVRLSTGLIQAHVLLGICWIAALMALAWWGWRIGRKGLVFVVAALIISYLPTANLFVLIQVFFAERIWYLPSVFVAGLLGLTAIRLLDRKVWRTLGFSMLAVLMLRCWVRNAEWKDNGTLFAAAYADHPQSVMARHLYGQWLTQNGKVEQGIALLQKALEIDLGFTDAHRSLGRTFLKAGRLEDALRELQIAQMQVPGHPQTQQALAQAIDALQSQIAPKLAGLEQAAREHPDDVLAQLTYIRFLRTIGKPQDALRLLQSGESRFIANGEWTAEMAATLVYLDRRGEAIAKYQRAVEQSPANAQLMVEAAMLLIERREAGDLEHARTLTQKAIELSPQSPGVHAALGEIQALEGNIAGARESFRRAIQYAPQGSEYARILSERAKALGQ